ncbi:chaperone protein DnaJ [Caballeronia sordidicola]|uniref:Chaperone protein DnaJ n=1 Tax=Caballeronia sordidicola TaxID=196367 RepID=A0A158EWW7_CABSO|nr:DnaJ domain-containing protein [Caballeronia sordidicola]SAL11993.1 chaperone protein DnaJ [Caballeronia sordidicola]
MSTTYTHYDNLKVARGAPPEVIRAAYKALSQRYHPDKNDSPDATRIMRILNDAYAVLSDPERRRVYDLSLEETNRESVEPSTENEVPPFHAEAPVPTQADPRHPAVIPMAGGWKRWFARSFDLWWETIAVVLVGTPLLARYSPGYVDLVNGPSGAMLAGLLFLPAALLLDAIIYRLFGNTPGKALLGARVGTIDGRKLAFQSYLGRNFSMWVQGLAFGIPIASLVTMGNQLRRLNQGKQTGYDEHTGVRVKAGEAGFVRVLLFTVAFLALVLIQVALKSRDQDTDRIIQSRTAPADYTWVNPLTQATMTVPRQWKSSVETVSNGSTAYMFTEASGHAVLVLGREVAPGWATPNYVRAFRKSVVDTMTFDDGVFVDNGNIWQADGKMSKQDLKVHIEIQRSGDKFWRIVAVQDRPYAYSDDMVANLSKSLWTTVW